MPLPAEIAALIATFAANEADYTAPDFKEAQVRQQFIDPLFAALGWDVANTAGLTRDAILDFTGPSGFDEESRALSPDAAALSPGNGLLLPNPRGTATKATAHARLATAASKGGSGVALKELPPDALILTRDPGCTEAAVVPVVRDLVETCISGWGFEFDPKAVYRAKESSGARAVVVALDWNAARGSKPTSREMPDGLVFSPVDARAALAATHALPGWAHVDAGNAAILDGLLGGETNKVSSAARGWLRPKIERLRGEEPQDQAMAIQGVIGAKASLPEVVRETVETSPVTVEVSAPVELKDYSFRGEVADAEQYTATYSDGAGIVIVAPKAPRKRYHLHTVQQSADAATFLPAKNRALVKRIVLNPVDNPDDPTWAAAYGEPDFHSYMSAGADGVVTIYPDEAEPMPGAGAMRGTMIHETGHTWSYQEWGTNTNEGKWRDWQAAMALDKTSVSGYAQNSIDEDVAETVQVYCSTKGKPKYDEYKAIVPHRLAMLEEEMA